MKGLSSFRRTMLIICMTLQYMCNRDFLLQISSSLKTLRVLAHTLTLLHLVYYIFFLYLSLFSPLPTDFDAVTSHIDKVFPINLSKNVLVF